MNMHEKLEFEQDGLHVLWHGCLMCPLAWMSYASFGVDVPWCPLVWMSYASFGVDVLCVLWRGYPMCPLAWMSYASFDMDVLCVLWCGWPMCPLARMSYVSFGVDVLLCPKAWISYAFFGMDITGCPLPGMSFAKYIIEHHLAWMSKGVLCQGCPVVFFGMDFLRSLAGPMVSFVGDVL